jgi:hypothetical protein
MPWPFDDKPIQPYNAMTAFGNGGKMPPRENAMSTMAAALLGKQTAPFPSDFFPQLPPLYQGEIRNAMQRPRDYMSPVAEALSPTLGGYGMGQLGADTALRASEGDWQGAAQNAPMLAMAMAPGIKKPLAVRPMSERALHNIGEANFTTPYRIDPVENVPIGNLSGGHHRPERVGPLADEIAQSGWIEPLVVDRDGNVIEGQHRLRALHSMGVESVPVHRLRELPLPENVAKAAQASGVHREQANQIADQIARIVDKEGVSALDQYEPPRGFERAWMAAVDAAKRTY